MRTCTHNGGAIERYALSEDPDVPQRTYTWGVDLSQAGGAAALDGAAGIGGLVAIYDPNDPNDPTDTAGSWAVLSDGNGNVVQLIDCTAATVNDAIDAHYQYDPYGNRFEPDPNDPNAILDATENWLRFSTKYFDAETGLGYWGYRYYDPQTGRWLTRDPIGEMGGDNLHAYCGNAPGNYDSIGLFDVPDNTNRDDPTFRYISDPFAASLLGLMHGLNRCSQTRGACGVEV